MRTRPFRRVVGALAVMGALLNVWVLAVHITSVALTRMDASGGGVAICHQGEIKYVFLPGVGEKPVPKKTCPICSGLANLHIGIIDAPVLHVTRPVLAHFDVPDQTRDLVVDHTPLETLNRGPPLLG